jgi:hypothetical protein
LAAATLTEGVTKKYLLLAGITLSLATSASAETAREKFERDIRDPSMTAYMLALSEGTAPFIKFFKDQEACETELSVIGDDPPPILKGRTLSCHPRLEPKPPRALSCHNIGEHEESCS